MHTLIAIIATLPLHALKTVIKLIRKRKVTPLQIILLLATVYILFRTTNPDDTAYRNQVELAIDGTSSISQDIVNLQSQSYFITAAFYNNEDIISHWQVEMLKLVSVLTAGYQKQNVFISIVENDSTDGSKEELQQLKRILAQFNIPHKIVSTDKGRPANLNHAEGGKLRIRYLAEIRNEQIKPLKDQKTKFDKIMFFNDVYFETHSIVELLTTNNGQYDGVCSLDFGVWGLYDLWVIRDRWGGFMSAAYPYSFDTPTRYSVVENKPFRVHSCWNGVAIMKAGPFYGTATDSQFEETDVAPVTFRTQRPDECYMSECYFVWYDARKLYGLNEFYVNPKVIVAYEYKYWWWHGWVLRIPIVLWWLNEIELAVFGGVDLYWTRQHSRRDYKWEGVDCVGWIGGKY